MSDLTLEKLKSHVPEGGLFADLEWLWSSKPFELSKRERKTIERLGQPLRRFQQASDEIYRQSMTGKLPSWLTDVLNAGKPKWLLDHQMQSDQREVTPRVIRPDLLLTEDGFSVAELDTVPGGIGTLAWLSQTYADAGFNLLGGRDGMLDGFKSLMPDGGEILVSEESSDYRPEMNWLADQLGGAFETITAEVWRGGVKDIYRFFELFDLDNIPAAKELAQHGKVTPPFKPHFEEKMWLALFWAPALKTIWERELRGSHLEQLKKLIPFGWVVDPTELPPHAALPKLNVHSWNDVAVFSQKLRRLVLKVSGFNELAWGSRGVMMGHDMPSEEWSEAVTKAQADFTSQPWVMQEFAEARLVEHPYFDPKTGVERTMTGRVRLCPYYFIDGEGNTNLGGCLATIVPADKKKIHGMRDGILVPCV
ncbi:hypothetical protein N9224_01775 [Akkermansiaceae bacterium]|nr:hypothetical protein [Akkermansiaceae bacterium]MDB4541667.1 hypothetical protein [Akkermansiaceae bacterium]